jgi:hypothetical protein
MIMTVDNRSLAAAQANPSADCQVTGERFGVIRIELVAYGPGRLTLQ